MRFAIIAVTLFVFQFIGSSPATALQEDALGKKLQRTVDEAVSDNCPAFVAVILRDGKVVGNAASGLRRRDEPENPVTINDKFHLGSCTKAMTATLVGILVDEGKLDWDDTIEERLPELAKSIDPVYREVTLWQLLAHRGGLTPGGAFWNKQGINTHENRLEIAAKAMEKKPEQLDAGNFQYSNLGYLVAGLFTESVTGESWETLIQQKVFEPLNMESAGFGVPDTERPATHPWGHSVTAQGLHPIKFDNAPSLAPAGTVHCSILDWARFIALHLDQQCKHHDLLKPETLKKLHTAYDGPGPKYGGGWSIATNSKLGLELEHNGSNTFWISTVSAFPENGGAVLVITNGPLKKAANEIQTLESTIVGWLAADE